MVGLCSLHVPSARQRQGGHVRIPPQLQRLSVRLGSITGRRSRPCRLDVCRVACFASHLEKEVATWPHALCEPLDVEGGRPAERTSTATFPRAFVWLRRGMLRDAEADSRWSDEQKLAMPGENGSPWPLALRQFMRQ